MGLRSDRQSQLLIDGKLVAGGGGTFPTVNPATEEVLGVAADATVEDMGQAIEAARRAFDETDWSTNVELRVRCVRQLQDALTKHIEELRELTISEVGAPRMLTSMAQLEGPVADLSFCADTAESYQWTTDFGVAEPMGIKTHRGS
jgi:aldehyde dehydrogenase (NAD+)